MILQENINPTNEYQKETINTIQSISKCYIELQKILFMLFGEYFQHFIRYITYWPTRWISTFYCLTETFNKSILIAEEYYNDWIHIYVYTNQELLLHDKLQKDFINVAAHELRTPIVPILGLSEFLYEKILNKNLKQEILKESLQIIVRNSSRLHKLIESLLDVTRIESDKLRLNKERFDIYKLVNDTINDFTNNFENTKKNIFKVVYSNDNDDDKDGFRFVYADKDRIQEVISNLLYNAYKFTENGQTIVKIKKKIDNENKQVKIIVKDSGTGIDKEILPRLFEKFATKYEAGTGLGLYISKKIVEAHGGKIWAENNSSDDRGATFYFILPLDKSWLKIIRRRVDI